MTLLHRLALVLLAFTVTARAAAPWNPDTNYPSLKPTEASLVNNGQIRYLWRDLNQPGRIVERITLSSFAKSFAPMVSALTMESPGSDKRLAPPPVSGGPSVPAGVGKAE